MNAAATGVKGLLLVGLLHVLLAPVGRADLIVEGGVRPVRAGPTEVRIDLGPFAGSAYWRHEVARGETLYALARRDLGAEKRWREILPLNPGLDPQSLRVGSVLLMPPKSPPAAGATPPRYDFFLWAPGGGAGVPQPFVPGKPLRSDAKGGHCLVAVEHAGLETFLTAIRKRGFAQRVVDGVVEPPWTAASAVFGGRQQVSTGAPVSEFRQEVRVTGIEGGVVKTVREGPQAVLPAPTPYTEPPPLGVLPPADPFAEPPAPGAPPVAPVAAPGGLGDAAEASASQESDAGRANPYVVAGLILAVVLAAFVALRRMSQNSGGSKDESA